MKAAKSNSTLKVILTGACLLTALGLGYGVQSGTLKSDPLTRTLMPWLGVRGFVATDRREVGEEYNSRLELINNGSFKLGEGKEAFEQNVETHFSGKVSEILLEHDGHTSKSYLVLAETTLNLKINNQEADSFRQQMLKDMSQGVLISRDRNGLIREMWTPGEVRDFSRDMLFAIVKAMQYNVPEGERLADWKGPEEDGAGRYEAQYHIEDQAGPLATLRREKLFFHKLNAQVEGDLGKPSLEGKSRGSLRMTYDEDQGRMTDIKGQETVTFLDENGQEAGLNDQTIDWKLESVRRLSSSETESLRTLVQETFSASKTYEEQKAEAYENQIRSIHEKHLGTDSLEEIIRGFADVPADSGKDQEQKLLQLMLKIRAFIYLHPEAVAGLPEILARLTADNDFFQTTLSALVNISSPEAQEALIETSNRLKGDPRAMQALVPALGFVSDPLPQVEETLQALRREDSDELKNMADLSLGILASQLAKAQDSEEKKLRLERLEAELVGQAKAARTAEDLRHQLDILGNLATEAALPIVEPALAHEDPLVREAAATALRDIDSTGSLALLTTVLKQDREADVRLGAASAMSNFRPRLELLATAVEALRSDPDHRVRIQLLQNIVRARFLDRDRIINILQSSSRNDPHEQARLFAENLLLEFQT